MMKESYQNIYERQFENSMEFKYIITVFKTGPVEPRTLKYVKTYTIEEKFRMAEPTDGEWKKIFT